MPKLSERGVIHLLLPLILLAGIIAGVFLITQGNPLKLFTRATNPPIVFKSSTGAALPTNSSGVPQSTSATVKIELTSTLGPPFISPPSPTPPPPPSDTPSDSESESDSGSDDSSVEGVYIAQEDGSGEESGGESQEVDTSSDTTPAPPPVSGPVSTSTVSYKIAENPTDLTSAPDQPYTKEPTVIDYTFKDANLGAKFIWVEFKDNTGKVDRRSAQIEIVVAPSGGTGAGFGKAIKLDEGSYVSIPVREELQGYVCSFQTLEMWIKMDRRNLGRAANIISKIGDFRGFDLATNGSGTLAFYVRGRQFFSSTPLTPDRWHHIAVVVSHFDSPPLIRKGVFIYLDGRLDGSMNLPNDDGYCARGGDLRIGRSSLGLIGEIDELRFRQDVVYTSGFTPPSAPFTSANAMLLHHFDNNFNDSSGNGLNGTGTGGQFVNSTIGQ